VVYMGKPFQATEDARYVDADNAGGVSQAVEYLYAQGRRRIALIAGVPTMRSSVDRTAGYRSGMASVGLPVDERLVVATDYGDEAGEKAMNQLLQLGDSVGVIDAVIAASDLIAIGVLRALRNAGIDVPADIAVIGFGDEWIAARSEPPLTTIAHNAAQMGTELARLMVAVLEGQQHPGRFIMPPGRCCAPLPEAIRRPRRVMMRTSETPLLRFQGGNSIFRCVRNAGSAAGRAAAPRPP
jgi:DNA-binding LacI/PurR family transcriptional regulator